MYKKRKTIWKLGKILFFVCTVSSFLTACSFEIDEQAMDMNRRLTGYWETVHMYEYEKWTDATGVSDSNERDVDVVPGDVDDYGVIRFAETFMALIATYDPESNFMLNVPVPYTLKEKNIYSVLLSGDYTDHMTIIELTDHKLVLEMLDEGTDDEGAYSKYIQRITFKKIK